MPADSTGASLRLRSLTSTLWLCIFLMSCAAEVVQQPAMLKPIDPTVSAYQRFVLQDALVTFHGGYERTLRKDTMWKPVGSVSQGKVYAPVGGVFSVEGAHVHEAYLVVSRGNLVGFYLPVERSYVALDPARVINLWEEQ